ncbi:TetR/AcrR family transcriptional regulator [Gordonia sp. NPDC003585]|uniref:TetR/AcrR family transcriptional regulator n=1 Tax=Gordonia sp. NPDC003585 TaxID=3154275 RepID=UPI0033A9C7E8
MTKPTTATGIAKRPGGRSERVKAAVFDAVGQLLDQGLRETMTIPQVAELAGVNPSSVYRRWGSMDVLLEQVAIEVLTAEEPVPDTGVFADDLRAWAQRIAADLTTPRRRNYLRAMVWARTDIVDAYPRWEIRRDQVEQMLAHARERGESVPAVDLVLDHVVAPLYHHCAFGMPVEEAWAERLVRDVLSMTAR